MQGKLADIAKMRADAQNAPSEDCISCGKPGGWVQLPKKPGLYHVTCAYADAGAQATPKQRRRLMRMARATVKALGRD